MALLTFLFVAITTFRSLNGKRRELGVFLALGMRRVSFIIFYTLEALFIALLTGLVSWGFFVYIVDPMLTSWLTTSPLIEIMTQQFDFNRLRGEFDTSILSLPNEWVVIVYAGVFVILWLLFIFWTVLLILKWPVTLLRSP